MNVFEAVKQSVTTLQAAGYYGIKVGRNGMACCIFHNDKTPSMKVDRRYYCFGCGAIGDVIDFAASLHGLGKRDAAVKLAEDFGINYEKNHIGAKDKQCYKYKKGKATAKSKIPKQTPEERMGYMVQYSFRTLCDYRHLLQQWKADYKPKPEDEIWDPRFMEALQNISYVGYQLDILLYGTFEEKAAWIAEKGKGVKALEQRISEFGSGNTGSCTADDGQYGRGKDGGRG